MKMSPDVLQDQLEEYEAELRSIKSYIKELNDMTDKHDTDEEHFKSDLFEAEHNVQFYDAEIARIRKELKSANAAPCAHADTLLPQTAKQGVGLLLFSSISFLAGALLGSSLQDRRKDRRPREGEG